MITPKINITFDHFAVKNYILTGIIRSCIAADAAKIGNWICHCLCLYPDRQYRIFRNPLGRSLL